MKESEKPVRFECRKCGACCRWSGSVLLTAQDITILAAAVGLDEQQFIDAYAQLAPNRRQLALIDQDDGSCVFLEGGRCRWYEARPEQCRTFPYAWRVKEGCPALDDPNGEVECS